MNYHPEGLYVWDTWYFFFEGMVHCIHLQQLRPGSTRNEIESGALGHAISKDLVTWETTPTALYRGENGSYDDCDLWTGSVIQKDEELYMFYCARSSKENGTINRIALATSKDSIHWSKFSENPLITPDPQWYYGEANPIELHCHGWPIMDCRDLCVVADPDGEGFWGFFAARKYGSECAETSVIGLCHSSDLIHWKQHPPCYAPEKYACVEVPEVFYLNGKWYMLCLTGNSYGQRNRFSDPDLMHATIYAVADQVQGPYVELDNNVLIGSINWQGFSGKTIGLNGDRYLFYTQGEKISGSHFGTVAIPKILKTDEQGHLFAFYYHGLDHYLGKELIGNVKDNTIENNGQWGSIGQWEIENDTIKGSCRTDWAVNVYESTGNNFMYTADIHVGKARSAGLVFRIQGDNIHSGAYVVILDADEGEVLFSKTRDFPRLEARKWNIERGGTYFIRITAIDAVINIFIDDVLAIQLFHPDFSIGKFGLFVEQGDASFSNVHVSEIFKG